MGFRYYRRVKLGKGFGLNLSKSGISPSYRGKRGSISSKGYSVRTGIPGLTYRKGFSKSKNNGCLVMLIFLILTPFIMISCEDDSEGNCNCSQFSSQTAAQTAFNNGTCGDELDRDNDGIACENLSVEP